MNSIIQKHSKKSILIIISLIIIFNQVYSLSTINDIIKNEYIFNDDVRQQIIPFIFDDKIVESNYILNYHKNAMIPIGVRTIYQFGYKMGMVKIISKILPFLLYIIFIFFIYRSSRKLTNKWAGISSIIIAITCPLFIAHMYGGLARAFASPAIAIGIYLIINGYYKHLSILTIATCLFYPSAAVVCGISLFISILFEYFFINVSKSNLKCNIIITFFCAIICTSSTLGNRLFIFRCKKWSQRCLKQSKDISLPCAGLILCSISFGLFRSSDKNDNSQVISGLFVHTLQAKAVR